MEESRLVALQVGLMWSTEAGRRGSPRRPPPHSRVLTPSGRVLDSPEIGTHGSWEQPLHSGTLWAHIPSSHHILPKQAGTECERSSNCEGLTLSEALYPFRRWESDAEEAEEFSLSPAAEGVEPNSEPTVASELC